MVSFTVTEDLNSVTGEDGIGMGSLSSTNSLNSSTTNNSGGLGMISLGSQLTALCIPHSPVAQGFLIWAMERAKKKDFFLSPAYPTTAPGMLSLARIIAKHHFYCRSTVLQFTLLFLKHSNPELSYQKNQALKERKYCSSSTFITDFTIFKVKQKSIARHPFLTYMLFHSNL